MKYVLKNNMCYRTNDARTHTITLGCVVYCRTVTLSNLVICHCLVPNSDSVILGTMDGTILSFDQVNIIQISSMCENKNPVMGAKCAFSH